MNDPDYRSDDPPYKDPVTAHAYNTRVHCLDRAIESAQAGTPHERLTEAAKAFERYLTGNVTVEISVSAPASVAHDVAKVLRDAGGSVSP
jgi:hypothetical protein